MNPLILLVCLFSLPPALPNLGLLELFAGALRVMAVVPLLVAAEFPREAGTRVAAPS